MPKIMYSVILKGDKQNVFNESAKWTDTYTPKHIKWADKCLVGCLFFILREHCWKQQSVIDPRDVVSMYQIAEKGEFKYPVVLFYIMWRFLEIKYSVASYLICKNLRTYYL